MKPSTILDAYLASESYKQQIVRNRSRGVYGVAVDTDEDAMYWQRLNRQSQAFKRRLRAVVAENDRLQAENARQRAALEAVEWAEFERRCPWCLRWCTEEHAPDCERQIALGLATRGADSAA